MKIASESAVVLTLVFLNLITLLVTESSAIEVDPSDLQVKEALQQGEIAAKAKIPPNQLYRHFGGSGELKPHGFLMTKMNGLTVMATHFALRSARPSRQDIEQLLNLSVLQVVVTVFGSSPKFAIDSYIVLKQSDQIIKPQQVRSDAQAARSSNWPEFPAYQAKIVASFPYETFDAMASTNVVIFPGEGGEISFDLDFSSIP